MRNALSGFVLLFVVVAAWALTGLPADAAQFPQAPAGHSLSPELRALVKHARDVSDDLDYASCARVRRNGVLAEYRSVRQQLRQRYDGETRPAVRRYIDDVATWMYDARENFFDDEFFFYCGWAYYLNYGKTPVVEAYGTPFFVFDASVNAGRLSRPDFFSALALESAGVIVNPRFGSVTRNDDLLGFQVNGALTRPSGGFVNAYIMGYSYARASQTSVREPLSTGGNSLNIYSPQGPRGALGGGVNVNGAGGFADVSNLKYSDDYTEQLGYLGIRFNPWRSFTAGTTVTPYVKLLGGYVDETSTYSGTTANGGLDFRYDNSLKTWRWGAELGAHIRQPVTDVFGLYGDVAVRPIYNDTSATSKVTFSGAVNASESQDVNGHEYDTGFVVGGGIYAQQGNAIFSAGAQYETWEIPVLMYSNTAPVRVDFDSRESVTAKVAFTYQFGPPTMNPERGF